MFSPTIAHTLNTAAAVCQLLGPRGGCVLGKMRGGRRVWRGGGANATPYSFHMFSPSLLSFHNCCFNWSFCCSSDVNRNVYVPVSSFSFGTRSYDIQSNCCFPFNYHVLPFALNAVHALPALTCLQIFFLNELWMNETKRISKLSCLFMISSSILCLWDTCVICKRRG